MLFRSPAALFPPPQLAAQRDGTAALSADRPGPLPWARAPFPARPFPAAPRHYLSETAVLRLLRAPSPLGAGKGSAIFFHSTVEVRDCAHRVRGEGQRRAGLRAQRCRRSALLREDLAEGSWRKAEKQPHTAVGTAVPKALSRSREAVRERRQQRAPYKDAVGRGAGRGRCSIAIPLSICCLSLLFLWWVGALKD